MRPARLTDPNIHRPDTGPRPRPASLPPPAHTVGNSFALDRVKVLVLLPDDMHGTTRMVADYFEVGVEAIADVLSRPGGP
ncbi:hypothetical protein ABUW04_13905 [Streptacidiphilus sp. N1-10]|uniref:Uncharacterized protein n=1 Tax=Streptacidiphilus jeojiensis TaxID=3229225 RepID=A0ABV6XMD8_9ACTN